MRQLSRHIIVILILFTSYNCNCQDNNAKKNIAKDSGSTNANTDGTVRNDHTRLKTLNYENWEVFWKAFTKATLKKDTATILQLTNFPFLQNTASTSQDEFVELWISQTYELKKSDTAVLSSELLLQLGEHKGANLPKFDSVHYTNRNNKDFYFAKVNGYYRLVGIITPG